MEVPAVMMFTSIYVWSDPLPKRLATYKARMSASAYYPSKVVPGERTPGWHFDPRRRTPGTYGVEGGRIIELGKWLDHNGWYGDEEPYHGSCDLFVPVAVRLTHGRCLAGWKLQDSRHRDNDDYVQVSTSTVFDDPDEDRSVVWAADSFAEQAAETERDYQQRQREDAPPRYDVTVHCKGEDFCYCQIEAADRSSAILAGTAMFTDKHPRRMILDVTAEETE